MACPTSLACQNTTPHRIWHFLLATVDLTYEHILFISQDEFFNGYGLLERRSGSYGFSMFI